MGRLVREGGDGRHPLGVRTLVGRSPRCTLQLTDRVVSGEHAVISWSGDGWTLRDLASRNGPWVRGERVQAGVEIALGAGDPVRFGSSGAPWSLDSASPPGPCAVDLDDGTEHESPDGLLALPDAEHAEVVVNHHPASGWLVEQGAETAPASDGDVVECAGRRFRLELPARSELAGPMARTADSNTGEAFDALALEFAVSRDEEYVELVAQLPERTVTLKPRAHHYALLTLARLRLKDAADRSLPSSSHGWVHHDDLARMLGLEPNVLNVQIFRARKQLAAAGFEDAAQLVERRPGARQLRLGTGRLRVRTL